MPKAFHIQRFMTLDFCTIVGLRLQLDSIALYIYTAYICMYFASTYDDDEVLFLEVSEELKKKFPKIWKEQTMQSDIMLYTYFSAL